MKYFDIYQMLHGLWKDISGIDAEIFIRMDANNLIIIASAIYISEQEEIIHMIQMIYKEA